MPAAIFVELFANPLAPLPINLVAAYAPATKPQPFLSPASIPNNFSTILGPSTTATEKAIKAIRYAMPLKFSSKNDVPKI